MLFIPIIYTFNAISCSFDHFLISFSPKCWAALPHTHALYTFLLLLIHHDKKTLSFIIVWRQIELDTVMLCGLTERLSASPLAASTEFTTKKERHIVGVL